MPLIIIGIIIVLVLCYFSTTLKFTIAALIVAAALALIGLISSLPLFYFLAKIMLIIAIIISVAGVVGTILDI